MPPRKSAASPGKPKTPRKPPAAKTSGVSRTRKSPAPDRPAPDEDYSDSGPAGRSLLIVESPSKAKTIAKYLGPTFKVLASYGHVRDLPAKGKLRNEEVVGIDIGAGWVPRYVVEEDEEDTGSKFKRRSPRDILDELGREAKKAQRIYLATDPDREGEAIAWHIFDELKLPESKTYRIRFNEITKTAIQAAIAAADRIDMDRVNAQETRRILDRVVGYPLSSFLSKKVTGRLSAGRVQSVAVRVIVDRDREIEAFKSEEYWRVQALLAMPGAVKGYVADPAKSKVFAKKKGAAELPTDEELDARETPQEEATALAEDAVGSDAPVEESKPEKHPAGSFVAELVKWDSKEFACTNETDADAVTRELASASYRVKSIEQKDRREYPQAPFTTSTLQQQANIRLRFATQMTMSTAQKLYEGVDLGPDGTTALITYMRTDSTRVSDDALKQVRAHIDATFGPDYLPAKANTYASGKSAQEAHEAVRPVNVEMTPARVEPFLTPPQYRLYKLIHDRFVASQMPPAVFAVTTVEVEAGRGLFRATGRIEKFDGYRRVMPSAGAKGDVDLPPLRDGMALDKLDLFSRQLFTQPPPRFNEASLVKMLEKEGIGRPSTYSSIIQTIQKRGYVEQESRRFKSTDLGKAATDLLVKGFPEVVDVKFTSNIESEIDHVEAGTTQGSTILAKFWKDFSKSLGEAKDGLPAAKGVETGEACPKCGRPLVEQFSSKTKRKFVGCSGFRDKENKCDYIKPREGEPERVGPEKTDIQCPKCGGFLIKLSGKNGVFFKCETKTCKTTANPDAEGRPVITAVETELKCDKCGKPMVKRNFKGKFFLGCSGYPKCRNAQDCDAEGNVIKPVDTGEVCEKCNSAMKLRDYRGRWFLACTAYPKCKNTRALTPEHKEKFKAIIGDAAEGAAREKKAPDPALAIEVSESCPLCESPLQLAPSRFGGGYYLACSQYRKTRCKGNRKVGPELQAKINEVKEANGLPTAPAAGVKAADPVLAIPIAEACPQCGEAMRMNEFRGRYFVGCSAYPKTKCKGTVKITPAIQAQIDEAKGALPAG